MDTAIIALIGTLFGGVILKLVDNFLSKGQKKQDAATQMRDELRKEGDSLKKDAVALREEIRAIEKELDQWKEKYYILLQNFLEIKNRLPVEEESEQW